MKMQLADEEASKESSHGWPRQAGRVGAQRGQTASQPQRWCGQKPQEDNSRPARRTGPALRPQELIEILTASICSRLGDKIIGVGYRGIRFTRTGDADVQHARTA
jgi:hypothetical protein